MRNVELLTWDIDINAPVRTVWNTMLEKDTYDVWVRVFNESGSWCEFSDREGKPHEGYTWNEGDHVRFVGAGEDGSLSGMLSRIKKRVEGEELYIEHYGYILNGKEMTSGEEIDSWAPSVERYTYTPVSDETTHLKVELESDPKYVSMFNDMWPKALVELKKLCEERSHMK
jgi:hypothetical protein